MQTLKDADPKSWPIVEVCDPSEARGMFLIWAAFSPEDLVYVVHAAHIQHAGIRQMASDIHAHVAMLPRPPVVRIMDRRGGGHITNQDLQDTWFTSFSREGLRYRESVDGTLQQLHDWLAPRYDPVLARPVPKMRFCRRVALMQKGPCWALERFSWNVDEANKVKLQKQEAKDFIDCLRYLACYPNLTWTRLSGQEPELDLKRFSTIRNQFVNPGSPGLPTRGAQHGVVRVPPVFRVRRRQRGF